jgi:RNA recognition motif-containing protein
VTAAIDKLNGITFMDRVLRVDQATEPGKKNRIDKQTNRLSVFVGHVPFDATEEEIREIVEACGPIHHVRLPRNEKGQTRGIAYITFQDEEAVSLALKFDKAAFRKQTITVQRSDPVKAERTKQKHEQLKGKGKAKAKRMGGEKVKGKKEKLFEKPANKAAAKFEGKRAKEHKDDKNQAIKTYLKMRAHVKRKRTNSVS